MKITKISMLALVAVLFGAIVVGCSKPAEGEGTTAGDTVTTTGGEEGTPEAPVSSPDGGSEGGEMSGGESTEGGEMSDDHSEEGGEMSDDHATEGGDDHVLTLRPRDTLGDHISWQHADRTARPVHELDHITQRLVDPEPEECVGVPATHLHDSYAFQPALRGDPLRSGADTVHEGQ